MAAPMATGGGSGGEGGGGGSTVGAGMDREDAMVGVGGSACLRCVQRCRCCRRWFVSYFLLPAPALVPFAQRPTRFLASVSRLIVTSFTHTPTAPTPLSSPLSAAYYSSRECTCSQDPRQQSNDWSKQPAPIAIKYTGPCNSNVVFMWYRVRVQYLRGGSKAAKTT